MSVNVTGNDKAIKPAKQPEQPHNRVNVTLNCRSWSVISYQDAQHDTSVTP